MAFPYLFEKVYLEMARCLISEMKPERKHNGNCEKIEWADQMIEWVL